MGWLLCSGRSLGSKGGGAVFALLFLVSGAIVVYLGIRWSLIGPIMIVERRFAMKAFSRSSELITGAWWRTFGILLVAGLIVRVPMAVLEMFWASIPVLGAILSGLVASIATAYSGIAVVVYYFDRRCRLEDFDLRRLAERIRSETVRAAPQLPERRRLDYRFRTTESANSRAKSLRGPNMRGRIRRRCKIGC